MTDKTYDDAAIEAFAAIEARKNGVWDHPALQSIGPLGREEDDILQIKAKFLADCGFTCGTRDPDLNRKYPGRFMVCECWEEKTEPTDDGSNGPWTIVGDDLNELIRIAFDSFASLEIVEPTR